MFSSLIDNLKNLRFSFSNREFRKKILFFLKNKQGFEVGGPSKLFCTALPIYRVARNIDGCNFSTYTVWKGTTVEGQNYNYYYGKKGFQYICEASVLNGIESDKYDFLLASHCLEHCANTIKTVNEWLRVVKSGGCMLLVLPDRHYTFDHRREVTSFEHFLDDFNRNIDEKDMTHFDEIISLHDLSMDEQAGNFEEFKQRSLKNYENRCFHHHVFDMELLKKIYAYCHVEVIATEFISPYHQIIAGMKK